MLYMFMGIDLFGRLEELSPLPTTDTNHDSVFELDEDTTPKPSTVDVDALTERISALEKMLAESKKDENGI